MLAEPGMKLRDANDKGTAVSCACGADLFTLAPGEGIYPRGTLSRSLADSNTEKKGECEQCGARYTISVSRWNSR